MGTRDDMCGIDVARMVELGGFAEEITIIGCVYKQDGDVLYRVTDDPDEAYRFYQDAAREGLLPTLPQIYVRREIIPAGQRERMTDEAKRSCAREMQRAFDARFWQLFDALAETAATDSAHDVLADARASLEGRYAREALALFSVFLDEALARHRLTPASYARFSSWAEENYEKMADDWIVKEQYERTFYGFASYRDAATMNLRVDTAPFNLLEKQQDLRQQGVHVTPIFKKTIQYRESAALPKVRRQFQDWLKETVQQLAVPFEEAINEGACSQTPFGEDDLTDLSAPAQTTLRYYQIFWGLA